MNKLKIKGWCTVDVEKFNDWVTSGAWKDWWDKNWSKESCRKAGGNPDECFNFFGKQRENWFSSDIVLGDGAERVLLRALQDLQVAQELGQREEVLHVEQGVVVLRLGRAVQRLALPQHLVHLELLEDVGEVPLGLLRSKALDVNGVDDDKSVAVMSSSLDNVSMNALKNEKDALESEMESKKLEMEGLEKEIQAKIDEYKKKLELEMKEKRLEIERMQEELYEKMSELEKKMFMLECEIYSIRCYTGEVINFRLVHDGKPANENVSVVINQKIRFLDEELGKAMAIYDFDGYDLHYFEDLLKYREDIAFELFAPQERSVSFVKVSKSKVAYQKVDMDNILEAYEKYHGNTIGIIIRNGEKIYAGWADEDMVAISGDNAYYDPNNAGKTFEEDARDASSLKSDDKSSILGRYFIFAMLQGVFDANELLPLPEKVSLLKRSSRYVEYAVADGWIADKRFGDFGEDVIGRLSDFDDLIAGDTVLTLLNVSREDEYTNRGSTKYMSYENSRGRGEANRTHDSYLKDNEVYKVNKLDTERCFRLVYNEYPAMQLFVPDKVEKFDTGTRTFFRTEFCELQGPPVQVVKELHTVNNCVKEKWPVMKYLNAIGAKSCKVISGEHVLLRDRQAVEEYVQVAELLEQERGVDVLPGLHGRVVRQGRQLRVVRGGQELKAHRAGVLELVDVEGPEVVRVDRYLLASGSTWNGSETKVNFEVRPGEVVRLDYLSSEHVKYALMNKNVGRWMVGNSHPDFAHMSRYLNKMLKIITEREDSEALTIFLETGENVVTRENWRVELSEWKFSKKCRVISAAKAKEFVKYMKKKEEK